VNFLETKTQKQHQNTKKPEITKTLSNQNTNTLVLITKPQKTFPITPPHESAELRGLSRANYTL
jgi:hypothetical protein